MDDLSQMLEDDAPAREAAMEEVGEMIDHELAAADDSDARTVSMEGERAEIIDIGMADDGTLEARVVTESGVEETVDADALLYASPETAVMVSCIRNGLFQYTEASANALLMGFRGGNVTNYVKSFQEGYNAAFTGDTISASDLAAHAGYDAGLADFNANRKLRYSNAVANAKRRAQARIVAGDGITQAQLSEWMSDENSDQASQIQLLQMVSAGTGTEIVLYDEGADESGRLKGANGFYKASEGNRIYVSVTAGHSTTADLARGTRFAIAATAAHELTHYIENTSPDTWYALRSAVMAEMKHKGYSFNNFVARQARNSYLNNGTRLTRADAEAEVIADAMTGILQDEGAIQRMKESTNATVWGRIRDAAKAAYDKLAQKISSMSRSGVRAEAMAIMRDGRYGENILDIWARGFGIGPTVSATHENVTNATPEAGEAMDAAHEAFAEAHPDQQSIRDMTEACGLELIETEDGHGYKVIDGNGREVKHITPDHIKRTPIGTLVDAGMKNGNISQEQADKIYDMYSGLMNLILQYQDQAMIWEIAGSEIFSSIKSNSDAQYGTTVDYGTICTKTQAIVDVLSETMLRKGRGLTTKEIMAAYGKTHAAGLSVPCPVCYVFSRWMGVPGMLDSMRRYQMLYTGYSGEGKFDRSRMMSAQTITKYIQSVQEKYGAKEGKSVNKAIGEAKTKVQNKLMKAREGLTAYLAENRDMNKAQQKKLDSMYADIEALEKEFADLESYNWVTQVLCKTDRNGVVYDKNGLAVIDPNFKPVPNSVLLDLRKGGEFAARYPKSWKYRTTRGAGMGKAIMPYSGAKIGDAVRGSNSGTPRRYAEGKNPFLNMKGKQAATDLTRAANRAKAQNLIGGQRFQSTSDFRPEWGIDYMMTLLEMQAYGSKVQLYTKVIEAIDMLATSGAMVNASIMGKGNGYHLENGKPVLGAEDFSSITGIDFNQALEKVNKYNNVQMILVGMNDTHTRLAMADPRITFIIPWHSSGSNETTLKGLMQGVNEILQKGTDYTKVQSDIVDPNRTAEQKALWDLRMKILTSNKTGKNAWNGQMTEEEQQLMDSSPYIRDLYDRFMVDESAADTYGVRLSKSQAEHIFPYEYWDTSLRIEEADQNGERFKEYCASMGIIPRFSGMILDSGKLQQVGFGDFSNDAGYWKLLIDRRMYGLDGQYWNPKAIDVTGITNGMIPTQATAKYAMRSADGGRMYDANTEQAIQNTIEKIDAMMDYEGQHGLKDVTEAAEEVDDEGTQYSTREKPLSQMTMDERIDLYKTKQHGDLVLGRTPKILRDIGFGDLPVTLSTQHADDYLYDEMPADVRKRVEDRYKHR